MSTSQRLHKLVGELLSINGDTISPTARFEEDLGADSLDMIELVMAVEEEFGLSISDKKLDTFTIYSDLHDYVSECTR